MSASADHLTSQRPWDPRIPARETCVLRYLVDHHAQANSDGVFVIFEGGETWTFSDLRERVRAKAAGLETMGVKRGSTVAAWLSHGREGLLSLFAVNYLGAVFVPVNTAYKGAILENVLANCEAELIILHVDLAARLSEINCWRLKRHIYVGGRGDTPAAPFEGVPFEAVSGAPSAVSDLADPIEPWDIQSIIYTSGTTGPSKGVLSSYLHLFSNAGPESWPMVTGEDRFLVNSPLFHIAGLGLPCVMLARGGSIALATAFSTEDMWSFARETQCTVMFLLGVTATFLLKRPPDDMDRRHKVRLAFLVPLTDDAKAFTDRFGVDIYTIFNMTEISSPLVSEANPKKRGTCGKPRAGVDVRLVDSNDCEIAVGDVGELIVRTDRPWSMTSGYNNNPEATAKAWRNGWFHTGDAFRRDDDGYFYFVDRMKDALRRRGENISSFEVEAEICNHPDVREAAVIGAPSEFTEDEVMAVIAPVPGRTIDLPSLCQFLIERLPYFMVPRYIRVMESLPKTPSLKVMKVDLRRDGVTVDTWDREKAGMRLRRESLA